MEDGKKVTYVQKAIEYAWYKGCTWAILTNFKEVRVLNAEIRDARNTFVSLSVEQFLDSFDKLWLLSRESFEKGIMDKEAEGWGKKAKKVPIDKQLLADFTRFRELLSKNITHLNYHRKLSDVELDESVQRIFDRLIFIRNAEDRELEEKVLISNLREWGGQSRAHLIDYLRKTFKYFDDRYDSNLFKEHLCDGIDVGDDALKEIISGLYQTQDGLMTYDFSAIEADVLGNIYEQYLGHILKKSEKRATITESHAHRKEQGIYYTPTYIVDYIVRNTLGELLKDKKVNPEKIKVLDPACGSGSFLIKAFDVLDEYHKKHDKDYAQAQLDSAGAFTTKTKILKNNIFGVDLDKQAVEIAQLNLLLKIAEKGRRLPLLQENIRCGNSLIDDPAIAGDKAFKWKEQFKEIMQEGGFDVIVGNPPYINAIQLTKAVGAKTKQYWKDRYYSAKGTYDIFVLFFEQSLNLCKEDGFVSFITPNKYLSSPYGIALRELISKNYKLIKVLDLSKVRIFNDPSVYPIITIIQKTKPTRDYQIITEKVLSENMNDKKSYKIASKNLTFLPDCIWGIILSNNIEIIEKVFQNSKPLSEVAEVQATSTAAEADEFSKYINENDNGFPIINTGTIDRYYTDYGNTRFMNKGKQLKKPFLDITKINETRRKLYKSPKIIIAKLALRIEGFLDNEGSYASINTNCIHTPKNKIPLEYFAGIVNSKLMSFIYSELFSGLKMSGGYFQFQAPQLRVLPITESSEDQRNKIVTLVKKMISFNNRLNAIGDKKTDEKAKIEEEIKRIDNEIDTIVYKIYGITEAEKKVIEESIK